VSSLIDYNKAKCLLLLHQGVEIRATDAPPPLSSGTEQAISGNGFDSGLLVASGKFQEAFDQHRVAMSVFVANTDFGGIQVIDGALQGLSVAQQDPYRSSGTNTNLQQAIVVALDT